MDDDRLSLVLAAISIALALIALACEAFGVTVVIKAEGEK